LVSSKYLTAFSDFRLPHDASDFVKSTEYVNYLEEYCTRFELWPFIEFSSRVTKIRRGGAGCGGHIVTILQHGVSMEHNFDAVAICSGIHMDPAIPDIPGIEKVPLVIHSSQFKSSEQLLVCKDPTVVVLGVGETSMDIGGLAITTPGIKSVFMCHREGFFCAPKVGLFHPLRAYVIN
jgi:dimethylaniline monooxygenase (N-oxide forming)